MKKTKIEQRIKNAVNAFFDDKEYFGENSLSVPSDSALFKYEIAERFNSKGNDLIRVLKRGFIFLPGAIYLFFGTLSVLEFDFLRKAPLVVLMMFLIGSFMTIFGIGNLKNPKHLIIPISITAVGIAAFALFSVFGNVKYVFEYGIYFFPLALIIPFLSKSWVDRNYED